MSVTEINARRCPSWCTTDHAKTDRFERYIEPTLDLRTHSLDVARIPNQGGNLKGEVVVDVAITDDLTNGGREGPLVSVFGAECMAPATAIKVASAILAAVELAQRTAVEQRMPYLLTETGLAAVGQAQP